MAINRRLFAIDHGGENVTLNYWGHPVNKFAQVADSYRGAASVLWMNFEADKRSDFDAYPLVFMYRQAEYEADMQAEMEDYMSDFSNYEY